MLKEGQQFNTDIIPTKAEQLEYLAYDRPSKVIRNLKSGLDSLDSLEKTRRLETRHVMICGGMAAFDKGILDFLNALNEDRGDIFLLSEVTAQYRRYTDEKAGFEHICTPHLLSKEMIICGMKLSATGKMKRLAREKKYVKEAIDNMEARYQKLGDGYACVWAFYAYKYINRLLDILSPRKIILWNEFYAFHHIFKSICADRDISLEYMEFGCIPGTFVIEKEGQQGESIPAKEPERFLSLPVSEGDMAAADSAIEFLKDSGLNRNIQPDTLFSKKNIRFHKAGRPIVAYMGQNDYESGLYPYTENTRSFHSPVFKTTLEALEFLALLALKNEWELVYRPHPIMESLGQGGDMKNIPGCENVTKTANTDINSLIDASDAVVTILSQSAYIALIREKPVVMLGYTQLKGKGCTYEAFCREDIEDAVKDAINKKDENAHKENFRRHTAQMLKYWLYDDMTDRPVRFGRQISQYKSDASIQSLLK